MSKLLRNSSWGLRTGTVRGLYGDCTGTAKASGTEHVASVDAIMTYILKPQHRGRPYTDFHAGGRVREYVRPYVRTGGWTVGQTDGRTYIRTEASTEAAEGGRPGGHVDGASAH